MVDVSVTRAVFKDGTLTITGAGFTKTTTAVDIDGAPQAFTWISETEVVVDDLSPEIVGMAVEVTKGEVSGSVTIEQEGESMAGQSSGGETAASSGGAPESPYPEQPTEDDELADATPNQMNASAQQGAQNPAPAELGTYESKEHLPESNVNEAVAGTKLDRIEEEHGIGPRDPYPTGNPPDPATGRRSMGLPPLEDENDGTV